MGELFEMVFVDEKAKCVFPFRNKKIIFTIELVTKLQDNKK